MIREDEERLSAIKYVVKKKNGYLSDLLQQIGEKYVDEFRSLGFIHIGCTWTDKTWGVNRCCVNHYKIVK